MQVIKLGGSVLGRNSIHNHIIKLIKQNQGPAIFVVSALQGITDFLENSYANGSIFFHTQKIADVLKHAYNTLAEKYISKESVLNLYNNAIDIVFEQFFVKLKTPAHDTHAYCLSMGERLSALLIAGIIRDAAPLSEPLALPCLFPETIPSFARVNTSDTAFLSKNAQLTRISRLRKTLLAKLQENPQFAFPGFYAVDEQGSCVLFGRGGSDYSAIALAAALNADCILCKDTGTVLSADPIHIHNAKPLQCMSYREALSLAVGGAKIIHRGAILLAERYRVPIHIADVSGCINTVVCNHAASQCSIKSISTKTIKKLAELSIVGEGITREPHLVIQTLECLFAQSIIPRSLSLHKEGHTIKICVNRTEEHHALAVLHKKLIEERYNS